MAKKQKILIAEDDPFLMKVMGTLLIDEGFDVELAKNGAETSERLKKNKYTLVLLDLIMPQKNGFEILEELKKENNKTPVLVFSNLSQISDKEEALSLGAKAYFVKSNMSIDDVVAVVKKYVSK